MAVAKSDLKYPGLLLNDWTIESVDPPLKSCWSECSRPLLLTRSLKYLLSKVVGVWESKGARLLSPCPFVLGQFLCLVLANDASIVLVSLYTCDLNVIHRACPIVCAPEWSISIYNQYNIHISIWNSISETSKIYMYDCQNSELRTQNTEQRCLL